MKWELIDVDESEIVSKYGCSKLLGKLLKAMNISDEQMDELMFGDEELHTSQAICVAACCQRILQAKENMEKVFIGGDYDADGICSTAIMKKTLDILDIQNGYYIPDRFREGYGLSANVVRMAHEKGYDLIITVDNGVKAHEAIAEAKRLRMDIIVTDHHRIEEDVEADIVVHPDYMGSEYAYLCGAGVALQISRNLIGNNDEMNAFAAVAHIGDVMPLWKETRRIVKAGIEVLKMGRPRSLYNLFYPGTQVNETTIAFQVVPKLNSVGRMNDISNVNTVVKYLLLNDELQIAEGARQLNQVNDMRRELSASMADEALRMCGDEPFPVIYRSSFHEGICGLAAGKLAEQLKKPVLVMAKNGDQIKGSGRSIPGFDMFAFFSDFEELTTFGGHEQAVGITVPENRFDEFRRHVEDKMSRVNIPSEEPVKKAIRIQADDISFDEINDLSRLSPYPKDVFMPYFAITDTQVLKTYETSKIAKFRIACANVDLTGVLYKRKNIDICDDPRCMIGTLELNRYRNQITCQMEIENMW